MKTLTTLVILSMFLSPLAEARANCGKVKEYYKPVNPRAAAKQLRSQINGVISAGQITIPYAGLWAALATTDAEPGSDDDVVLLYTQRTAPDAMSQNLVGIIGGAWNREHVWPQSRGLTAGTPEYSDLHHIRPTDYLANRLRGHKNFGGGKDKVYGSLRTLAGKEDTNSFEPNADAKGDVARMLLYMTIRYPRLELIDSYAGVNSHGPKMGRLCTLVKWHNKDQVSAFEKKRNNRICQLQLNRNPFIDHPEWVAKIWGATCR